MVIIKLIFYWGRNLLCFIKRQGSWGREGRSRFPGPHGTGPVRFFGRSFPVANSSSLSSSARSLSGRSRERQNREAEQTQVVLGHLSIFAQYAQIYLPLSVPAALQLQDRAEASRYRRSCLPGTTIEEPAVGAHTTPWQLLLQATETKPWHFANANCDKYLLVKRISPFSHVISLPFSKEC